MKWLYGWVLVGLYGLMLFCAIFPHIVVTLLVCRYKNVVDSERRSRLGRLHRFWGLRTWDFVRILMRLRVDIDTDSVIERCPFIVIANHRTAFDHVMIYLAAAHAGITDLRWVLKRSMLRAPVIGWLNFMMGSAFLSRSHDQRDFHRLDRSAKFALEDRASIIIYPEGTRFRGVPDENARFRNVREPKVNGYACLLASLPTYRTLLVTIDWGRLTDGVTFTQAKEFLGRRVRLRIRDIGIVPVDQAGETLNVCWIDHERFLEGS